MQGSFGFRQFASRCAWVLAACLLLGGCTAQYPARHVVGETLPTVTGRSLADKAVTLPDAVAGRVVVLFVVYDREAHDDVRPWADTVARDLPGVQVMEVGVVLSPWLGWQRERLFKTLQDKTPRLLRSAVVLLHDEDAAALGRFTGNREPEKLRVLLLDETGEVLFFNADGYNEHSTRWLAEAYRAYQASASR
jgi:hypothetical protein